MLKGYAYRILLNKRSLIKVVQNLFYCPVRKAKWVFGISNLWNRISISWLHLKYAVSFLSVCSEVKTLSHSNLMKALYISGRKWLPLVYLDQSEVVLKMCPALIMSASMPRLRPIFYSLSYAISEECWGGQTCGCSYSKGDTYRHILNLNHHDGAFALLLARLC